MRMISTRLRTIDAAARHFRELDPGTAITAYLIRRGVKNGTIPHVKAGTKYLVSLDTLEAFFAGQFLRVEELQNGIRVVAQ
jgi:hypothetical protein